MIILVDDPINMLLTLFLTKPRVRFIICFYKIMFLVIYFYFTLARFSSFAMTDNFTFGDYFKLANIEI